MPERRTRLSHSLERCSPDQRRFSAALPPVWCRSHCTLLLPQPHPSECDRRRRLPLLLLYDPLPQGFSSLADATLAYRFIYPTRTASGAPVSPVLTRTPEKYSSAAPLSADARQRIVAELFDLTRFVTVSVTVGPASGVLRDVPQERWSPRDVALTVLIDRHACMHPQCGAQNIAALRCATPVLLGLDANMAVALLRRSTARLSSGQRTALNDVVETRAEERDGATYYVYEHTSQGSPTVANPRPETFRHALAVTTTRPGLDGTPYLYTLNLSCPQVRTPACTI